MVLSESASTARPLAERTDAELQAELARASKIVATVQAEIEQRKADRLQVQAERRVTSVTPPFRMVSSPICKFQPSLPSDGVQQMNDAIGAAKALAAELY